jgi:riboflavin synthase
MPLTCLPIPLLRPAVEEMGSVRKLEKVARLEQWDGTIGEGWELELEADVALGQASLGCSIAVNGVCLTVTEFDVTSFKVGLAPETLRRSNLGDLSTGDPVNLERALPADGRNSGHFVQGHVDDVGTIAELRPDGDSLFVSVKAPPRLMPYIVPKGFIAIDGTSLTVVDVDQAAGTFSFMLIEFTQQKVIIPKKKVGDKVNLEVDVISKYVEQSLAAVVARVEALEKKLEEVTGGK